MILITGASRGIGKFLFQHYSRKGESVLGTYLNTSPSPEQTNLVKVDVTDESQIESLIAMHLNELHEIKLLHCAGTNFNAVVHKIPSENWMSVMKANLCSAFLLTKHLIPIMKQENYGRIVFFSSVVSELGVAGTSAYSSSKAGLWGLAKSVSKEIATKNITCNCLNLGYFDIGMISEVPKDVLNSIVENIPMRKLGNPANIISAVDFLVASDYTTGTTIDINGGLH